MGETAGRLSAAQEATLREIEARWGAEQVSTARNQLRELLVPATELASRTAATHDTTAQRTLLEDLVTRLCALGTWEVSRTLLQDDQVVSSLVEAIRLAVWLGVPEAALRLAGPVTVVSHMLGPDHPHTLTARFALASAYRAAGDPQSAARLGVQVVEGTVALLGPDHPRTLTARSSLAGAYRASGQAEQAARMYEELVADTARLLGRTHPDALSARNNLAQAYESCGRRHRALTLYDDLVRDAERVLGPQHPYLAVFVRNRERARSRSSTEEQRAEGQGAEGQGAKAPATQAPPPAPPGPRSRPR